MPEPVKDINPTHPAHRLRRLRTLLNGPWAALKNVNRIDFQKEGDKGRWVCWSGDPLEP